MAIGELRLGKVGAWLDIFKGTKPSRDLKSTSLAATITWDLVSMYDRLVLQAIALFVC
jgi:hypothetical protein